MYGQVGVQALFIHQGQSHRSIDPSVSDREGVFVGDDVSDRRDAELLQNDIERVPRRADDQRFIARAQLETIRHETIRTDPHAIGTVHRPWSRIEDQRRVHVDDPIVAIDVHARANAVAFGLFLHDTQLRPQRTTGSARFQSDPFHGVLPLRNTFGIEGCGKVRALRIDGKVNGTDIHTIVAQVR